MLSLEQVRAMLESAADQVAPSLPLDPTVTCSAFMLRDVVAQADVGKDDIGLKVVATWIAGRAAEVKGIVTGAERESTKTVARYIAVMIGELAKGSYHVARTIDPNP